MDPDLPVGALAAVKLPRPLPPRTPMEGRFCRLVPTEAAHAAGLFTAFVEDVHGAGWTYLPYGPFPSPAALADWLEATCLGEDPLFHTILAPDGKPVGVASYLRITPAHGVIEIGHIHFAPALQGTAAATEAMALMLARTFDELGYRRVEWKCDALNSASRRAAERLGFTYEGTFRQAAVVKGRNRDTAWFARLDVDGRQTAPLAR